MHAGFSQAIDMASSVLRASDDAAIRYFTRRDLLGEDAGPVSQVWHLPEAQKLLKKQRSDGSWRGPKKKTPVYPENHTDLIASFKTFRTLVERYEFTREMVEIERAAEYLFSFQTGEGDIRGFIGNQYATYYTGYVLSLLIRAGFADDLRVAEGLEWLLAMRQDDGGWSIPILTRHFDGETMYRLTSSCEEPAEPDRTQPFSHNWTDMVLRGFAIHPSYRDAVGVRRAGELLKSRFFQKDRYSSYRDARYWTRFVHWWPNLLTALESLSLLGFIGDDPAISKGLTWFTDHQQDDGLWYLSNDGKPDSGKKEGTNERAWLSLRICRMLRRFEGA